MKNIIWKEQLPLLNRTGTGGKMKMTEFKKGYLIGFLVGVVCMIICATTHDYLENAEKNTIQQQLI